MEMTGEYRIAAPRQQVWEALNDPEILKASIPGCETLEKTSDTGFAATVTAKVGPVKAKFKGEVTLSDLDPPNSYTISGEGKGGAAGFAKGGAKVALSEDGADTILRYEVDAAVGGKLAQIGSRLIDGVARKMADEFFGKFSEQVTAAPAAAPAAAPLEAPAPPPEAVPVAAPAAAAAAAPAQPDLTDGRAAATEVPPEVVRESFETGDAAPEMLHTRPDTSEHRGAVPHDEATKPSKGIPTWAWVAGVIVVIALILLLYGN